jgi:hypothetical protein
MSLSIQTSYIDSLHTSAQQSLPDREINCLQGGYVEFSFLDQTYSYFFVCSKELDFLRLYIQEGKPLEGLRALIRCYYAPNVLAIRLQEKEPIIIWNYEFDFGVS